MRAPTKRDQKIGFCALSAPGRSRRQYTPAEVRLVLAVESEKVVTDTAENADIRTQLNLITAENDDRPWVQVELLEDGKDGVKGVIH